MSLLERSPDSATNNGNVTVHVCADCDTFGVAQLIQEPNRVTLVDIAALVYHVATSHLRNILESGVLNIALSNHYPCNCIRKFMGSFKCQHKIINTRKMKNFNQESFLSDL